MPRIFMRGSIPPGRWLTVTCGLTACTPGSAPGQTLGNDYVITLPLLYQPNVLPTFGGQCVNREISGVYVFVCLSVSVCFSTIVAM